MFYRMFYFTCHRSLRAAAAAVQQVADAADKAN